MITIYKYPLLGSGMFSIINPIYKDALPLCAGVVRGQICIWFQVNTDNEQGERKIHIRGTGQPFTGEEGAYIGTIITPSGFVWHYYDEALAWEDPPWTLAKMEAVELGVWEEDIIKDNPLFPETTYGVQQKKNGN